jgi:hypothetical protein
MSLTIRFKKSAVVAVAALVLLLVGSGEANAQSRREIERERQRIEREQRRYERQRGTRVSRATENRIHNSAYSTGYEQGLLAGEYDRRRGKYNQSNVYRGTGSAPNGGDPSSTDYVYRQGYLQGYSDGFSGRRNY